LKKIAIVDASSRTLPYDVFYINEVSKRYKVDFYFSNTNYNISFLELLKNNKNVKIFKNEISQKSKFKGLVNYFFLLLKIYKIKNEYHKIHFQWFIFFPLEILFFLKVKSKLIFTFHNVRPHNSKINKYFPNKILYSICEKVVFVSNHVKNEFFKTYNITDKKKAILVKHGILPISVTIDSKPNYLTIRKKIIFWGNIKKYKGISIFKKIIDSKLFLNYELEIYGKWDTDLLPLKKELIQKGIFVRDEFIHEKNVIELLNSNSIFIMPYKNVSQSGILYTLIHYKILFVSTSHGDNRDFLIKYKLNDLLFDFNDISSLKKSIDFLEANKNQILTKLNNAREEFEWKNISYHDVYI